MTTMIPTGLVIRVGDLILSIFDFLGVFCHLLLPLDFIDDVNLTIIKGVFTVTEV